MINVQALRGAIYGEYRNISEFCDAAGVPRATMENLLSGRSEPMWSTLEKIMSALHQLTAEQKHQIFFAQE